MGARLEQLAVDQTFGDLHRVQGRALEQLVAGKLDVAGGHLEQGDGQRLDQNVVDRQLDPAALQPLVEVTAQLEQRKTALERRLEELRTFEREYRTRLKSYLESQLRDLDASGRSDAAPGAGDMAEAKQG